MAAVPPVRYGNRTSSLGYFFFMNCSAITVWQ
jgi:hypothetical protein